MVFDPPARNIHFRSIRPDDWNRLQRFHSRLSEGTIQRRFHGSKRVLSDPLAHRFTDIDGRDNAAIVATTGTRGRIVGVARYNRISPTCAEVAFVIEDSYQHRGIGSRLMRLIRQLALDNGITEFIAEVLPGNEAMFRLLRKAGSTRVQSQPGECQVYVKLLEAQ